MIMFDECRIAAPYCRRWPCPSLCSIQGCVHGVPAEDDREAGQGRRPDLELLEGDADVREPGGREHHGGAHDHDRGVEEVPRGDDAPDLPLDPVVSRTLSS